MYARTPAANAAVAIALSIGLFAVTVCFALDLFTDPWVISGFAAVAYIAVVALVARVVGFSEEQDKLPTVAPRLLKPVNTYTLSRPRSKRWPWSAVHFD